MTVLSRETAVNREEMQRGGSMQVSGNWAFGWDFRTYLLQ